MNSLFLIQLTHHRSPPSIPGYYKTRTLPNERWAWPSLHSHTPPLLKHHAKAHPHLSHGDSDRAFPHPFRALSHPRAARTPGASAGSDAGAAWAGIQAQQRAQIRLFAFPITSYLHTGRCCPGGPWLRLKQSILPELCARLSRGVPGHPRAPRPERHTDGPHTCHGPTGKPPQGRSACRPAQPEHGPRPALTQAEPAAGSHGGAEPVHVGVALRVRLPHHLRLHDLGFPGHGGGSGARWARSVPQAPAQPSPCRSRRASALTAAPPPCAPFKAPPVASLRNLPPRRKVRGGAARPARRGGGGDTGTAGPGMGGDGPGARGHRAGGPGSAGGRGMNGERPRRTPERSLSRPLSPLKVTRRRVGTGRNHRSALCTESPQNHYCSVCLFFPQGGPKKYQQASLTQKWGKERVYPWPRHPSRACVTLPAYTACSLD